jgi:UDP-N-acetylglucosamine--N-acetylmuramyl-(pentapeptide) pyrophosphoryl-undecaprenol N-acetylglucosamine transferase
MALKSLARFADAISVSAGDSQKYFTKKVVVTGYPVRPELAGWKKSKALTALELDDEGPVLLVVGGSKGAHSINEAVVPQLPSLLELAQVVHVSGTADWPAVQTARKGLTSAQRRRYHVFPYLHEQIGAALAAADLVVARAGASSLGEFPFFGLPAVLVPYPHAWRYQKVNADYLAERGAAVIVKDELLGTDLLPVVRDLLENPAKRAAMSRAMKSLAHPQAAQALAGQILQLGGGHL